MSISTAVPTRLTIALVILVALAILGVEAWDRPESAVEASARRYAAAVTSSDLDGAMAEIAPGERAEWNAWVQSQLGNVYDVTGVAVRARWLFGQPTDVTVDVGVRKVERRRYKFRERRPERSPVLGAVEIEHRLKIDAVAQRSPRQR